MRVIFAVTTFVLVLIGFTGVAKQDLTRATIYFYGGILLAMLLVISAFFDSILIKDSIQDNYNKCVIKPGLGGTMQSNALYCDYTRYYTTVVLTLISAISLVFYYWELLFK